MEKPTRIVDIELTNTCNTACIFCPRDKTPKQGFFHEDTFRKAIERIFQSRNRITS